MLYISTPQDFSREVLVCYIFDFLQCVLLVYFFSSKFEFKFISLKLNTVIETMSSISRYYKNLILLFIIVDILLAFYNICQSKKLSLFRFELFIKNIIKSVIGDIPHIMLLEASFQINKLPLFFTTGFQLAAISPLCLIRVSAGFICKGPDRWMNILGFVGYIYIYLPFLEPLIFAFVARKQP